jgi:hypothetical protein
LHDLGIPTPRGGRRWHAASVRRLRGMLAKHK